MNTDARNVIDNLNALFLKATTPYAAPTVMMIALNVLCPHAASRAAVVVFRHLLPPLDAQPVQVRTAAVAAEAYERGNNTERCVCFELVLDMMPTGSWKDVP